jgi:hypothetical protein
LKPAQAFFETPISKQKKKKKKITKKRAGGVAQSVVPEFKPQFHQRKKK